jgi:hypothetical protein
MSTVSLTRASYSFRVPSEETEYSRLVLQMITRAGVLEASDSPPEHRAWGRFGLTTFALLYSEREIKPHTDRAQEPDGPWREVECEGNSWTI